MRKLRYRDIKQLTQGHTPLLIDRAEPEPRNHSHSTLSLLENHPFLSLSQSLLYPVSPGLVSVGHSARGVSLQCLMPGYICNGSKGGSILWLCGCQANLLCEWLFAQALWVQPNLRLSRHLEPHSWAFPGLASARSLSAGTPLGLALFCETSCHPSSVFCLCVLWFGYLEDGFCVCFHAPCEAISKRRIRVIFTLTS